MQEDLRAKENTNIHFLLIQLLDFVFDLWKLHTPTFKNNIAYMHKRIKCEHIVEKNCLITRSPLESLHW